MNGVGKERLREKQKNESPKEDLAKVIDHGQDWGAYEPLNLYAKSCENGNVFFWLGNQSIVFSIFSKGSVL